MRDLAQHFLLREDVVFLNHGSYGACPRCVFSAYQDWQLRLERQPVEFLNRRYSEYMRVPREAMAAMLGTSADNIVGVVNATEGLNIVAQSLELEAGDEILTSDHEYAALDKTWAYVARRTGARIVIAEVPLPLVSEDAFVEAFLERVTSRTKVLFISHITSPTALVFPIARLVSEMRERGILTMIDGAHTPGQIEVDLEALGADFYSGNCHKWLLTPKGSAYLYVRPELQHLIKPLVISHGWTLDANKPGACGGFGNSAFIDGIEMQGTRDPSAWLTVPAGLDFHEHFAWAAVARDCRVMAQDTATRIQQLTGLAALSTPEFCAPQMVAMPVPDTDPAELQRLLMDRHRIEIPVFKWKNHTIVRVSVQGYNTGAQLDLLCDALAETLVPA